MKKIEWEKYAIFSKKHEKHTWGQAKKNPRTAQKIIHLPKIKPLKAHSTRRHHPTIFYPSF